MPGDPVLKKVGEQVRLELEQTFMFYLPRICEHCLNPSCVSSCPSGAMYKRTEDGIVLVDQDRVVVADVRVGLPVQEGWTSTTRPARPRNAPSATRASKSAFYGVVPETCVGRLRYIGLVLYDVDRVLAAASVENDTDLYEAQRQILLDAARS